MRLVTAPLLLATLLLAPAPRGESGLARARALAAADKALAGGDLERARVAITHALELDPNARAAWALRERWAERAEDADVRVHALHKQLALARAQAAEPSLVEELGTRLAALDPHARELAALRTEFVAKLTQLAQELEKGKRPHAAIRSLKLALALDPGRGELQAAIQRIATAPDPSLAEDARPRDLFAGLSAEWIAEHDAQHREWSDRAVLEKPNYRVQTDAGYEVLVRTAEAMEQMNAFYRVFFRYGSESDKRKPSRIDVNIFKSRDEYTKDPKDWTAGHFTGSAVETYIGPGGFEEMTGTLFHEASHQFVSLATNASGWLDEGLASFFEGTRVLANGTVVMNLPANHRLFPLAARMERGFMSDAKDGIDPEVATKEPSEAPTFRIVLEDQYEWGPPWYAPTWGVVYFLYNLQDPADGRYVYRKSFFDFVDASGGKMNESAVKTFEETVLARPEPPTDGVASTLALPRTVDELNAVWRDWILTLRDRQRGSDKTVQPYLAWARHAVKRGALADAAELFEKAWQFAPRDVETLEAFAGFLAERKQTDRAVKLLTQALSVLEGAEAVDAARVSALETRLHELDPTRARVDGLRAELVTRLGTLLEGYLAAGWNLQAMEVAAELASELEEPALLDCYARAVRAEGRANLPWRLVYDEQTMAGWSPSLDAVFKPAGENLAARFGTFTPEAHDYILLTLDQLTSGDFSLECEVEVLPGKVGFAGLVFGRKSDNDCHALVLFPPAPDKNGFLDLVTFYGAESSTTWRRTPVQHPDHDKPAASASRASTYYKLRLDVTGRLVDTWVDGAYQATQEFPSLELLRGSFGLIVGRGEARFRKIRFLARPARDPSAAIERALVLERSGPTGAAINGSWLGQTPPFPTVQRWLQGSRASFEEARGAPQLVVLWSIAQNERVAIDGYLRALAEKHASIGLACVNVLAFWEADQAKDYLAAHPLPGVVALDTPTQAEHNYGVTFERFEVQRFQLPRLVLLDVDGTVVWEGDPGFSAGRAWSGGEALLDVPLRELVAKRRLKEVAAWRASWPAARAALAAGDLARAAPALVAARPFDAGPWSEVDEAQAALAALERSVKGLERVAGELAAEGREPAVLVLCEWAEALGLEVKRPRSVAALPKCANVAAWKRALDIVKPLAGKSDAAALEAGLAKLAALGGAFPAELASEARGHVGDADALRSLLENAPQLPARWLARHFGW